MPYRLEVGLKPELFDAEGHGLRKKAREYFGLDIDSVRSFSVLTFDLSLSREQLERIRTEIFTNPVTQISSYKPMADDFDWTIWVGLRPGVRDNPGATAREAVEDLLGFRFQPGEDIYTSKLYSVRGTLSRAHVEKIAHELLANGIVQQWKVFSKQEWNPETGIGIIIPKVLLDHQPKVTAIPIRSDDELQRISDERNLALNPRDIPTIRAYFLNPDVLAARQRVGLTDPTDVEIEYISQARSDHCNHNTFHGLFKYIDRGASERCVVDDLFKTCIQKPTLEIQKEKPWVISVLWDNAGVARLDENHYYVITGETHNSPSNMEAYGGALTGIVGVYRDPMGTGLGSKLIAGMYGYCVGHRDYRGDLKPHLHPRRLLDGVIEGVRDGGNKSGIPTPFGGVYFHDGFIGKCLVFVTALGLIPAKVDHRPSEQKTTTPGDLIVMVGGRVGKDGIHGVTAASEEFSEHTPAGHVQIGDPYTQKKMHDFLIEARDAGLIRFVTDNGGGGLSSSIGESARFSNGCEVELDRVPLKYEGLDQWEIWVSESQERMTVAILPEHETRFMELSRKHGVESTVIGRYSDSGKLHIRYHYNTCAYVDMNLLESEFPQWEFDAEWIPPELRGLCEPVLGPIKDHEGFLTSLLSRPNMADKEWIARQYDHEVQGTSVIKPLVGRSRDVPSDAFVIRPVLEGRVGLAAGQAVNPTYSAIDAYHMTTNVMDEAYRRVLAVGANPESVGGVDNFCWPNIQYDPRTNPNGKFKAAQLVRSNWALRDLCLKYGIPLLSGKDSMYIDGMIEGPFGQRHKISGPETLQFTCTGTIPDVSRCVTMDFKFPGDLVYLLGWTKNELGGSEFYNLHGYDGLNIPVVRPDEFLAGYRAIYEAIHAGLAASVHGVYRGGLAAHVAMCAMASELGVSIDLRQVGCETPLENDTLLYSESAGRFLVSVAPENQQAFEAVFKKLPHFLIGRVEEKDHLVVKGKDGITIMDVSVAKLKHAWKSVFGELI